MCATWLNRMYDMTHSYVYHDLHHPHIWTSETMMRATWLIYVHDMTQWCVRHDSFTRSHSRKRPDLKYLEFQIWTVFPSTLLSDGDSVYSHETLLQIFGTPEKTCLICTSSHENLLELLAVVIILSPISSVRGTWLTSSTHMNLRNDDMCDMTHLCARHVSMVCTTWLTHSCDTTRIIHSCEPQK